MLHSGAGKGSDGMKTPVKRKPVPDTDFWNDLKVISSAKNEASTLLITKGKKTRQSDHDMTPT